MKRAIEVCGVLTGYAGYVTADRIVRTLHDFDPTTKIDETGVKRAFRTIEALAQQVVESRPGVGYRIGSEAATEPQWVLPLLAQYLAATQPEVSFHPALEGLVHRHGVRALHYLVLLSVARDLNMPVSFLYANSGSTKPLRRKVRVLSLLVRGARVILAGQDVQKKQMRQFLLTRMAGPIEILPQKLPDVQTRVKNLYSDSLTIFLGGKPRNVAIRFTPELSADVKREFFHSTQTITENSKGITLQMRVNNQEEVFAMMGQYLGRAELLEPQEWRQEYVRRLKEGLRKNSVSYRK